jgi:VWFA-related protein
MRYLSCLLLVTALCGITPAGSQIPPPSSLPNPQDQQPGPPGTIRVRVRLIPVDVTVTDSHDVPITDLKQEDFQVYENGRRQEVRHFSMQNFAEIATTSNPAPQPRGVSTTDFVPQPTRTFLILLGRGRHQSPLRAVDSLIRFVRKDLLPQDRVAVFAYNSATDFTTDHERIAEVLERYKKSNDKIESWLDLRFRGLATVYGIRDLPKALQPEIDKIFNRGGVVASRQVPPGRMTEKGTIIRDWDRAADAMLKDSDRAAEVDARQTVADEEAAAGGPASQLMQALIKFDSIDSSFITLSMPFDQYAPLASGSFQDLQNLFTCIEYLRYMEGEKHLIFYSSEGLLFPNGDVEYDRGLVAMANDARVAISAFQTGGTFADPELLPTKGAPLAAPVRNAQTPVAPPPPVVSPTNWSKAFMASSMFKVSQYTGGRAAITEDVGKALTRLNRISQVQYLLGYYPDDNRWDGKYRQIQVKVDRAGAKVSYRRGYYARDTLRPYDREEFLSFSRISAAGSYEGEIGDLPVRVITARIPGPNPQIKVDLQIDSEKVGFKMVDLRHVGRLRCALFYADGGGNSLGDSWQNLDLDLTEEKYQQYIQSGIQFSTTIPQKASSQIIKIVVYDTIGDRIGSKVVKVR